MSKALTVLTVGGILASIWVLYRKSQGLPVIPIANAEGIPAAAKATDEAHALPAVPAHTQATIVQEENAHPATPEVPTTQEHSLLERLKSLRGNLTDEAIKNQAAAIGVAAAAAGATVAAQKLRQAAKAPVTKPTLVKQQSGVVKSTVNVRTHTPQTVTAPKTGHSLAKPTIGTGAHQRALTTQVPKPDPIPKASAIKPTVPKTAATAIKVGGAAARVASRAILPVSIALGAYDITTRAQAKGAENLDVGDAAAAASGLGGLGLRKYLPEPVQGALQTKFVDLPKVFAGFGQSAAEQLAAAFGGKR